MAPTATTALRLLKREAMSSGARAGTIIGIVVVIILVILIGAFFIVHLRRRAHNASINNQRAILAGEKYPDGTDKPDKFTQTDNTPKRNKSVKDRLMGPLYRGSVYDMPAMPARAKYGANRQSTMSTMDGEHSFLNKPWEEEKPSKHSRVSVAPSFSSKRATRMMMVM